MGKKNVVQEVAQGAVSDLGEDPFASEDEVKDPSEALSSLNFDVNDEYKPDPLIPRGTYHGVATKITFSPTQFCIIWDFCLHDNGGVMSDGETSVDGAHVYLRNWLPKPGDEDELTKSGRSNKRQSKINMLKNFQDSLGVDMSTPAKLVTALEEQQWIGIEADLDIDMDEWEGRFRNTVNRAKKSTMY